MDLDTFTLREFAEAILEAEPRNDFDRVVKQLRNFANRELLTPGANVGPRRVLFYHASELCLARILMTAVDRGFESANLAQLVGRITSRRTVLRKLAQFELSFAAAFAALGNAENWEIEITHIRTESGDLLDHVLWKVDGNRHGRPDPMASDAFTLEGPIEAVTVIPFTRLCAPLVTALRQIGERWE